MTEPLFPSLPGLGWDVTKAPHFAARHQRSVSGRELVTLDQPLPIWEITVKHNYLRDNNDVRAGAGKGIGTLGNYNELRTLMGFFCSVQGSFQTFLFDDPTDDAVVGTGGSITGVATTNGNGSAVSFQLARNLYPTQGFVEPIVAINAVTAVYLNGVLDSAANYSINAATGVITFTSAPANNAVITWTGTFYFRCRFSEDTAEFSNFMYQLWENKQLKLRSVLT